MLEAYQHIPELINPIAFSIGFFSMKWYSIMYLVGFAGVYFLLLYRIKKGENEFILKNDLQDLMLYLITGLLAGARLGYVLLYDASYFFQHPLSIIFPVDQSSGEFSGIAGMSYHGGLIGIIIAGAIFARKHKFNFWRLADFVVPAIPAGYFFGRLGNFLNGELYGRATGVSWGMYFPNDILGLSRHPSQLYEAFFEGLVLFAILWLLRNRASVVSGRLLSLYIIGYSVFRFCIEFFREPDSQVGIIFGYLTIGQILSLTLVIICLIQAIIVKYGKIVYTRG
jgi:phosphatidylglycerol:prolipoprotein diacylglycerol transferase